MTSKPEIEQPPWREGYQRHYDIIFGDESFGGKAFDLALLWVILLSVVAVMLETVEHLDNLYHLQLEVIEWVVTILFTVEYFVRVKISRKPMAYIFSFFGLVDLLSILPTFIGIFYPDAGALQVVRAFRLIRVFRVLHVEPFQSEVAGFVGVLKESRGKVAVFVMMVLIISVVMGALMYIVEGPEHGFRSIPEGMYWAVVTMGTIGYGDLVPSTAIGKVFATLLILLGYSLIVVPTGIITSIAANRRAGDSIECPHCETRGHTEKPAFCHACGRDFAGGMTAQS